ncbi:hypothetical protein HNV11_19010 [Spirosoma taeanense]|uniref:Uncharacterized protein n=1 Tax=Spirosoma taeanense TaxID=2735870 RepID=A0A6M5YAX2_9BACT|nr:hypothetical protein [Spirosoma taeanense]QJW91317.1 hypothetical protein HNV11_19010 [Spirosoma taeanense]
MAQERYILHFKGDLPLPAEDLQLIQAKTQLIDASQKALLVELNAEEDPDELAGQLAGWTVSKESHYPIPTTRPTVRKPPEP